MSVTITNYISSDHEGVWALFQKTISENDGFVKNLSFHTDIQNILEVYDPFFVMRDGQTIIGMVGLKKISSDTPEIKRLQINLRATYFSYQSKRQFR
jgi:hypothetical protein